MSDLGKNDLADDFQENIRSTVDSAKKIKKGTKGAKKAVKAAGKAGTKIFQTIGHFLVVTYPWSLIVILALLAVVVILYMVVNSPIFNTLVKLFQGPSVDDIREYINNTQGDTNDWRFAYNKMLPEEQYAYIYFGNHPDKTGKGKEVKGLADYVLKAYKDARKAFEQDLGDIEAYHDAYFNGSSSTVTIDDVYPHAVIAESDEEGGGDSSDLWNEDQIKAYLGGTRVVEVNDDWYKPHSTSSGVFVRSRMEKYIKKLESTKTSGAAKYKGGFFDYFEFEPIEEGKEDELPVMKRRLTLNLDLTYLANHETLVGDLEQAEDGKIVKESDLTNVVTYLISGMNVATCDISPSKGYLDFLKKTIGNPDVFNPANKYKGQTTIPGILGALIKGITNDGEIIDYKKYSLYTPTKVRFKYKNKKRKEKMGLLDTTSCEIVVLEGTEATYKGKYGEPVYQYYIVLKNPVDTDRLLWAMFVSDAAKTVTYKGIFNKVYQAYQGSYYDMYSVFEPLNAELEKNFFARFFGVTAADAPALSFAKYADSEEIRKYLYGLNQEEVEKKDNYFKKLWKMAESDDKQKKYTELLKKYYLVDKNQDGKITYKDYTGLLNETYYTFHMRPLYKCDNSLSVRDKHNLAHDGFGVNEESGLKERCLWHKIFKKEDNSSCESCIRKNGGYECADCGKGGVNCAEWASDWPPECPEDGCGKFAQRALHGKIKVEYVRDPKPEFAALITISEDEYKEKIDVDIGSALAAVKGNGKVDLKTNYNRLGYGNNYDPNFKTELWTPLPEKSTFVDETTEGEKDRYYFSVYEFYGEYALGEKWAETPNAKGKMFNEASADLIEFNPDESKLKEFESLQEISEEYNREQWNKWSKSVNDASGDAIPANYRAVSILSALYKRKYYYHNLLNSDSYEAGMFGEITLKPDDPSKKGTKDPASEKKNYERPVANYYYDPDNADKFNEEFDKDFTSDQEDDTAFYGRNLDGFNEDKGELTGENTDFNDPANEIVFERTDASNSYFKCVGCEGEVAVPNGDIEASDENETALSITCPHCGAGYIYQDSELLPGGPPASEPPM